MSSASLEQLIAVARGDAPGDTLLANALKFGRSQQTPQGAFGAEVADRTADLLSRLDSRLPRPATWVDGPGGLVADDRPWDVARADYWFVDEFAALRPLVEGEGSLERFDYWLDTFQGTWQCTLHSVRSCRLDAAPTCEIFSFSSCKLTVNDPCHPPLNTSPSSTPDANRARRYLQTLHPFEAPLYA